MGDLHKLDLCVCIGVCVYIHIYHIIVFTV